MLRSNNVYIGKRKSSVAKVFIQEGTGKIILNNIELNKNILLLSLIINIYKFLKIDNLYDTFIKVKGGGISSQQGAIHLALCKAVSKINTDYHCLLRKNSYLTSDSRIKERRKYGLKKARKASQFTKR
jgi:small subunit ribosomal protein S9